MIRTIIPSKDNTIYEDNLSTQQNTGMDEVLELVKSITGVTTTNSRILLQYNLEEISASAAADNIPGDALYYLNLRTLNAENVLSEYSLEISPLSGSWSEGVGRKANVPITTTGSSWVWRDDVNQWATSSYAGGTTGSYTTNPGGGSWLTTPSASQAFTTLTSDLRVDVTGIVTKWISGSFPNNGFIIKRTDSDEQSQQNQGILQFFSTDTNTIYIPTLTAEWDDSAYYTTASNLSANDVVVYTPSLRKQYKEGSIVKVDVKARSRFPQRGFVTSSNFLEVEPLPSSSYYGIRDAYTEEIIVPYSSATKISNDVNGSFFRFRVESLLPERYYRFVFKIESDDGGVEYFDNGYHFKVKR